MYVDHKYSFSYILFHNIWVTQYWDLAWIARTKSSRGQPWLIKQFQCMPIPSATTYCSVLLHHHGTWSTCSCTTCRYIGYAVHQLICRKIDFTFRYSTAETGLGQSIAVYSTNTCISHPIIWRVNLQTGWIIQSDVTLTHGTEDKVKTAGCCILVSHSPASPKYYVSFLKGTHSHIRCLSTGLGNW